MPLVQKPFGDIITFTRASSATMFDSSGTLVYAPMNLLTYSQDLSNAVWTLTGQLPFGSGSIVDDGIAPDGTTTADKVVEDTSTGSHLINYSNITTSTTSTSSLSFFIKAAGRTSLSIRFGSQGIANRMQANIDLNTGAVTGVQNIGTATEAACTATLLPNQWWRITASVNPNDAAATTMRFIIYPNGAINYTGDGVSGVYIWGAQLNQTPMQGGVTGSLSTYYPTTSAAYYGPRLDYDPATLLPRGFLVEEQRTNSIRNNTMQGAVAGVIGSGGAAPTNWSYGSSASGLTREVVGTGTENGVTYIDLKVSGTSTSSGTVQISPEAATGVAALTGQTWTGAWYVKLVSGSFPGSLNWIWIERDSGGSAVVTVPAAPFGPPDGSALNTQRYTSTRTLSGGASVAYITLRVDIVVPNSTVVDFTLRIGLPQLELGAFATSVIPTTTTALTRSADVALVNTLSPWFNATEGSLYAEASRFGTNTGGMIRFFQAANSANRFRLADSGGARFSVYATTTQADLIPTGGAFIKQPPNIVKAAGAYKTDDVAAVANGNTVVSAAPPNILPPGIDTATIGIDGSTLTTMWNGWIRRITYYPRRVSNAELQALTA